jgi:hypothetical protein
MRTSCDIDILVQECDLDAAADALVQKLQFTKGKKEHHDISLFSPVKVRLELHFSLEHVEHVQGEREILHNVWQHVLPEGDSKWRCRLTDEMFYFYHITHMAKHLQEAECSIRPFLDLWIMNHRMPGDPAAREALLSSLRATHDSAGSIEGYYATAALSGMKLTVPAYMEALQNVTRDQVAAAARTVKLHTSYFLKGESQ